ncbi:hypothetical protein BU14_0098s0039 [Porphyra umbilicalis]|uniref:Malectin domain-containing protein n=1 Tax=Porphyra umbilicalis TaxID=2786 RepID=A0A1X6PDW3_PORUM|nr:hypothetical protein BU14_0098s0039 [Porphyra umbilicalis]|eukprot:OSX78813.1 hypothetical protein BU14_0098s0039 [Porphyra umbilicalis]
MGHPRSLTVLVTLATGTVAIAAAAGGAAVANAAGVAGTTHLGADGVLVGAEPSALDRPSVRTAPAWWTARQAASNGSAPAFLPARSHYLNVGGDRIALFGGHVWLPDVNPGSQRNDSLLFGRTSGGAAALPTLFQTSRFSLDTLSFTRTVPAASHYQVQLLFAEIFRTEAGVRLMDGYLSVDGGPPVELFTDLDVFARVGGDTLLNVTTDFLPVARQVTVTLQRSRFLSDNVFLNALAVIEAPRPLVPTPTPNPAAAIAPLIAAVRADANAAVPLQVAHARRVADADAQVAAAVSAAGDAPPGAPADALAALTATAAAFNATASAVDDQVTALDGAAAAATGFARRLSPPVCAFLNGGASSPVTRGEVGRLRRLRGAVADALAALEAARDASLTTYADVLTAKQVLTVALSTLS